VRPRSAFALAYFCSGAAALVYETAWTRLLTLYMGHTAAASSIVLAAFMGGLAAGAWLGGGPIGRRAGARPLRAYVALELLVAVEALAVPVILAGSRPLLAWGYLDATAPLRFALVRAIIGLVLVGVPAVALGATFPIAAAWASRQRHGAPVAGVTGGLYAINTAGAAAGALATGFWLLPAFGLRGATWTGVALNAIAATVAPGSIGGRRRPWPVMSCPCPRRSSSGAENTEAPGWSNVLHDPGSRARPPACRGSPRWCTK
jgi:spermidine synthase